ncbi:MAG: helix-turn-helix transcriptional regulator [Rhodothermales bacterium]|nr:helix-turn-helix transcriptional regulator [Rhodothermales bacterium]
MGERDGQVGREHIGAYLRGVRESRRLSLDAVVEMTGALPGRVTKSYLSRMENGQLEPTFPRLYALSQVYGVPIASLAERFEVDLRRRSRSAELAGQPVAAVVKQLRQLDKQGRYNEVLDRVEYILDGIRSGSIAETDIDVGVKRLRIPRVVCLGYLDRFHSAKDECEDLLAEPDISPADRALTLYHFAHCCRNLGRFPLALIAVAVLEQELPALGETPLTMGNLVSLKGNIHAQMNNSAEARDAFCEAVKLFEANDDGFSACRHRINYATMLADCGKPREALKQLTVALRDARKFKYERQAAFALHGIGKVLYRLNDLTGAASSLMESNVIGRQQEYMSLVFCNCYYLWRIAVDEDNVTLALTHRRSLRSYLPRVPSSLAEARAFRAFETEGGGE